MLSFLTPWALLGGLLLAIPIIVHLFQPKRVRQTPFSSLRWLHLTQQRLARRIKWHQILLFLLRASFIVLLVLALAKPLLHEQGAPGVVERFIVLDTSRSMGYRAEAGSGPLEVGKQAAADLIAHAGADDRTAVLLTGATTRLLSPLTQDTEILLPALRAVQAGATDTDLSSALPLIRTMLPQCRSNSKVELFFVTDRQERSWNPASIANLVPELPAGAEVRIVDAGIKAPQNAWIADARLLDTGRHDGAAGQAEGTLRVQVRCIGDSGQKRTVWMTGVPGLPEASQPITLNPGEPATVDFKIPASVLTADAAARLRIEPADALPDDDDYLLNLSTASALRILLLESDSAQVESLRPAFHLRMAVEALAQSARGAYALTRKSPNDVTPQELAEADCLLLADVPDLSDANLKALHARVLAGAGLALFLGPAAQLPFYNTRLYEPLRPGDGLLPMPLRGVVQPASNGGLAALENLNGNHPLLAGLSDPLLGDLSQTRVQSYYRFDGTLPQRDTVLAWIDGSTPAIIEHPLGAGKVIVLNFTANDAWSDLPRRKAYLPLIDRLLAQLSGGGTRHTFTAGEGVTLALRDWQPQETIVIHAPDGRELPSSLHTAHGQTLVRVDAETVPGIYRLERQGGKPAGFPFVVQASRGDSDLTPQDAAALKKWWEPADFAVVEPKELASASALHSGRRSLWPALMLTAGVLLLAEMFFVHWLCPRVNPALATSIIGRRGSPSTVQN